MMHVAGYETSASEAALTAITPIPDGLVQIQSNDILVPSALPNLCWASALINSAAATERAQLTSPSLRGVVPIDISPIASALVFGSIPRGMRWGYNPVQLAAQEPLDALVQNGAAVMNRVFVHFCDGPLKPVTGRIYSIRFTLTASLVTATWVNSAISFATALPAGNYQVVGLRTWSANAVYSRLFFKGSVWRPGAPAVNAEDNNEWPDFRFGTYGVFDVFNNVTPPSVDVMGVTDTAEQGYLDIIKM